MDLEERVGKLEYQAAIIPELKEKNKKLEEQLLKLGKNLLKNLKNFETINEKLGTATIKATDIDMTEIIAEVKKTAESALQDLDNKSIEVTLKDIDIGKMSELVAEQLQLKKDTENPTPLKEKNKKLNVKSISLTALILAIIIAGSIFFYLKPLREQRYKTYLPKSIRVYNDQGAYVGKNQKTFEITVVLKDSKLYFESNGKKYYVNLEDMKKFYAK